MTSARSVFSSLAEVLTTVDPWDKAACMRTVAADFRAGDLPVLDDQDAWPEPASRQRPPLRPPSEMRRRGLGSVAGRCALLHAVAHIELNAIDLATDMAGRFAHELPTSMRDAFVSDWISVADDEARHFVMVADRLEALGSAYGALPAHDGLWQAARRTRHDVLARLVIAPLVLEARGLDVTPNMINGLTRAGDIESANVLKQIHEEEIGHVAMGRKWLERLCARDDIDVAAHFAAMVEAHFPGGLKEPFNAEARRASGMPADWYEGLS